MATMASLSNLRGSARGAAFLARMLNKGPFLRYLESVSGWEADATAFDYRVVKPDGTVVNRDIGGDYTPGASTPGSLQTGALKVIGEAITVDISYITDALKGLRTIPSWFESRIAHEADNFALGLETQLFKGTGTGTPAQIKGLKTILDGTTDIPGAPSGTKGVLNAVDYSLDSTPKSLDLIVGSTKYTENSIRFISELLVDAETQVGNPTALVMNATMAGRVTSIAYAQKMFLDTRILYGVPLTTINGIPIIPVDNTVITNTEPDDTATPVNTTTSIYVMAPAEMSFSLVSNSGLDYVEFDWLEAKESGEEKWECRVAWKIEDYRAVRRIRNIKVVAA